MAWQSHLPPRRPARWPADPVGRAEIVRGACVRTPPRCRLCAHVDSQPDHRRAGSGGPHRRVADFERALPKARGGRRR
eukprot:3190781-Prymnesium_polylepis.1